MQNNVHVNLQWHSMFLSDAEAKLYDYSHISPLCIKLCEEKTCTIVLTPSLYLYFAELICVNI